MMKQNHTKKMLARRTRKRKFRMSSDVRTRLERIRHGAKSVQGSHPFSETNFQDFSRTSPGLRLIFQGYKIHINSYNSKISK